MQMYLELVYACKYNHSLYWAGRVGIDTLPPKRREKNSSHCRIPKPLFGTTSCC